MRARCADRPDNNNRRLDDGSQQRDGLSQKRAAVEIVDDAAGVLADSGRGCEALPAVHQEPHMPAIQPRTGYGPGRGAAIEEPARTTATGSFLGRRRRRIIVDRHPSSSGRYRLCDRCCRDTRGHGAIVVPSVFVVRSGFQGKNPLVQAPAAATNIAIAFVRPPCRPAAIAATRPRPHAASGPRSGSSRESGRSLSSLPPGR